jgi:hypothetical protein
MKNLSLSSDIDAALATLQSARTAAAIGDSIATEEALIDAYHHLSKLLRNVEVHERGTPRTSVNVWRSHRPA